MRIIAGTHRGRPYLPPQDEATTRPITDRVKEALFNRLQSLGMLDLGDPGTAERGWAVADVFAGTGSLGLEALSRGASHCVFVEQDRDAVDRLKQNLDGLGLADRATVLHSSALVPVWPNRLPSPDRTPLRLAFLDPPYVMLTDTSHPTTGFDTFAPIFAALLPRFEPGGLVVLRTPTPGNEHDLPDAPEYPGYDGPASIPYGGMTLHFYQTPLTEGDATPEDSDGG
ncbi:MAG: RsmD family RNA methyltransferase [Planctomycetota bacterium]